MAQTTKKHSNWWKYNQDFSTVCEKFGYLRQNYGWLLLWGQLLISMVFKLLLELKTKVFDEKSFFCAVQNVSSSPKLFGQD